MAGLTRRRRLVTGVAALAAAAVGGVVLDRRAGVEREEPFRSLELKPAVRLFRVS